MQTYGFGGLIGALAVGLKLIAPRETPIPTIPSLKCHHLPMLLGIASMFCWTLNITAFAKVSGQWSVVSGYWVLDTGYWSVVTVGWGPTLQHHPSPTTHHPPLAAPRTRRSW